MFGVNTSQIRFWEKEFDILKPHKNKKGNRQFTKKDVENIRKIFHLVKERGFKLNGAKAELKKKDIPDSTNVEANTKAIEKLTLIKEKLLALKK